MLKKLLSKLTGLSFRTKVIIIAVLVSLAFAGGWHAQTIWDGYNENKSTKAQLVQAKEAPAKIIRINQQLRATNVDKDYCAGQPIPADALRVLHQ